MIYSVRSSFRTEGEIESFSNKQKLKMFTTTKETSQEMVEEFI